MVGCVIAREDGNVLGVGHHRHFGGAHAEVEALASCRRLGNDPGGATAWVTLEPCDHFGKTPPCSRALINAAIKRVVIARRDPHKISAGGMERLVEAGVEVVESHASVAATRVSDPFVTATLHGRPWVIAKWAQTIDGAIATSTSDSQWISGPRSRRLVHRWRGRVDVVLTAIGTVLADDPRLTCRGTTARKHARRVIVDAQLKIPESAAVLRTMSEGPITIVTLSETIQREADRVRALESHGVEVLALRSADSRHLDLAELMKHIWTAYQASNVLVEAGMGLLSSLFAADLVDETRVFVGAKMLGDKDGLPPAAWQHASKLASARSMELYSTRRTGDDVLMVHRRPIAEVTSPDRPSAR